MHSDEVDLLRFYFNRSKFYFEYGCGGSTVLASSYDNIKKIVCVDSCLNWIEETKCKVKNLESISFNHVDINADCTNWGAPSDKSKIDNWPIYYNAILENLFNFDLVLVDGRFRVCCCAAASIRMLKNSFLLLHDCERHSNVPLNKVDQVRSLAVYAKNELSDEELFKVIEENRYNYQ